MLFHPSQPNTSQMDTLNDQTLKPLQLRLDQVPINTPFIIEAISPFEPDTTSASDLSKDLESLGFLPNEQIELLACAPFSGDPLVVRVGLSKFALRRAEAAYIRVRSL